jgi:hypothetical protein
MTDAFPVAETDANADCNDDGDDDGDDCRAVEGVAVARTAVKCCRLLSSEEAVAKADDDDDEIPRRRSVEGCEKKNDETGNHAERRKRALREGTIGCRLKGAAQANMQGQVKRR